MKTTKTVLATFITLLLLSSSGYAKKDKYEEYEKDDSYEKHMKYDEDKKMKKEKHMPYGLQKKVERDGELPPGWQRKFQKGEVLTPDEIKRGRIIYQHRYPVINGTDIYEIENKIIRVVKATREIIEVFK